MTVLNVALMSLAEIFGNVNMKWYAQSELGHHLMGGIFSYAFVLFFLIRSFGHGNMLWVTSMWEGMIVILSSIVAFFYLGERFDHPIQYLGILLAVLAMVCVNWGGKIK